jgi:isoleucyl-tRNA synthetase
VKFPLTPEAAQKFPELKGFRVLIIWTTTPWTLPANLAVAIAPNLEYVLLRPKNFYTNLFRFSIYGQGSRRFNLTSE